MQFSRLSYFGSGMRSQYESPRKTMVYWDSLLDRVDLTPSVQRQILTQIRADMFERNPLVNLWKFAGRISAFTDNKALKILCDLIIMGRFFHEPEINQLIVARVPFSDDSEIQKLLVEAIKLGRFVRENERYIIFKNRGRFSVKKYREAINHYYQFSDDTVEQSIHRVRLYSGAVDGLLVIQACPIIEDEVAFQTGPPANFRNISG